MECPDCKGKGTKPRTEAKDGAGAHWSIFPMLCDRCSGSGEVLAAKPKEEGQAVVAVP
jgi:DnaJ-class molecular chaperone